MLDEKFAGIFAKWYPGIAANDTDGSTLPVAA